MYRIIEAERKCNKEKDMAFSTIRYGTHTHLNLIHVDDANLLKVFHLYTTISYTLVYYNRKELHSTVFSLQIQQLHT